MVTGGIFVKKLPNIKVVYFDLKSIDLKKKDKCDQK